MKFPWRLPCRRRREWCVALTVACTGAVVACGPEFPNSYYAMPESELLAAPEGFFAAEIARLEVAPPAARAVRGSSDNPRATIVEIEVGDVRRALEERGVGARQINDIVWNYETARRRIESLASANDRAQSAAQENAGQPASVAVAPGDDLVGPTSIEVLLPGVPAQFAHYLRGARAWHRGELATARKAWGALLELPVSERRMRSTWAAFMLGRAWLKEAEATDFFSGAAARQEAKRAFRQTRQFALDGLPDVMGLAASSLGWEARVALAEEDFPTAVTLYLEQHAAGDPSAVASLRITAGRMMAQPGEGLERCARHAASRRVITAYIVSRTGSSRYDEDSMRDVMARAKAWASVLEKAGVVAGPEADRLAWLAYEAGFFPLAEQWAKLAAPQSPEANWIRAKLALRAGDVAGGEKLMRAALASPQLGEAHRAKLAAELSRVCLARDDYAGALTACLAGRHWEDAAFVAERVMTTAELIRFVEARPVPSASAMAQSLPGGWTQEGEVALRTLLARRLAREGRAEQAEIYFAPEQRAQFTDYVRQVRAGFDITRPATERARAFWSAAQSARRHGMELLGTELEPDWSITGGSFGGGSAVDLRLQLTLAGGVLAPSAAEVERLKAHRGPEKRFHYRYRAAELAWWAASLLPNDSDETAEILTTAGGWLKARDPQAAQPFYQALVIRCGNTALGREAARKRWFPARK